MVLSIRLNPCWKEFCMGTTRLDMDFTSRTNLLVDRLSQISVSASRAVTRSRAPMKSGQRASKGHCVLDEPATKKPGRPGQPTLQFAKCISFPPSLLSFISPAYLLAIRVKLLQQSLSYPAGACFRRIGELVKVQEGLFLRLPAV